MAWGGSRDTFPGSPSGKFPTQSCFMGKVHSQGNRAGVSAFPQVSRSVDCSPGPLDSPHSPGGVRGSACDKKQHVTYEARPGMRGLPPWVLKHQEKRTVL